MRKLPGAAGVVIAVLAIASLAGCVEPRHSVIPEPRPSATPIFATDEDALAAAEKAYAAYLAVSDAILADGGRDTSRIEPFVSETLLPKELDGFKLYSDAGWRFQGGSTFDSVTLQQYVDDGSGTASVNLYTCLDVSAVRIIDSTNTDVTPPNRSARLPLEVGIQVLTGPTISFLVDRSDLWSGADFCN
jgi:hypothetical protein